MKKPWGLISLDREWNNAQLYNAQLLALDSLIHDSRLIYETTPNQRRKHDTYSTIYSLINNLLDFMIDSPRFNINRIETLQKEIQHVPAKVQDKNYRKLIEIHREIKKLFRQAKVMDFASEKIHEDEVLSQAMK